MIYDYCQPKNEMDLVITDLNNKICTSLSIATGHFTFKYREKYFLRFFLRECGLKDFVYNDDTL